jgi:hypothetical protein
MSEVSLRGIPARTAPALGRLALVVAILAVCAGCGSNFSAGVKYKPLYLPVTLSVGISGDTIEGNVSFASDIGQFSIGARYNLEPSRPGSIYVILRSRKTGYDHIFEIKTGGDQFTAVVNGTTSISITNNQVLIDVTNGNIKKISFKSVNSQISEQAQGNWMAREWHKAGSRWDEGLRESWYKPYGLTRWAYDDSTIDRWYGVGFVWFLLRLILAIFMAIVDTVLSLGFLVGQIGFMLFGPTGRDLIYGLLVLGAVVLVIAAANS